MISDEGWFIRSFNIYIQEKILKWFNNIILSGDKCYIKNNVKPFIRKLTIIKFIIPKRRLKDIVIIKSNNIIITVKTSNNLNIQSIKTKSAAESINIKSIKKPKKNLKISILKKTPHPVLKNCYQN